MSLKLHNTVTYSDKKWTNVENKYNLLKPLELVIKEDNPSPDSSGENNSVSLSRWTARAFMVAGLTLALGNLPMQSRLLVDNTYSITASTTSFEINSNSEETIYSLASYERNDQKDSSEYIDINVINTLDDIP